MDKIIIIENKNQALEYLKNKNKFLGFTPICFTFPTEKLLSERKIKFKMEEDYETDSTYEGNYSQIIKNTDKICREIKIKYRRIELMKLFYKELSNFFGWLLKYSKILQKINEKEKPSEVVIFKDKSNLDPNHEICSRVAQEVFKDSKMVLYNLKNKREGSILKIICRGQKIFSKLKLKTLRKKDNKIFICGSKKLFEPLISSLLENDKNKLFRCYNHMQKSFFVDKKYIPFYQFCERKNKHQNKLKREITNFKNNNENLDFLRDLNIDEKLILPLIDWVNYYLSFKFIEISAIINDIIRVIKTDKINLILLYSDAPVFEKTFAEVGKKFNIPSIVLQHGVIGHKKGFSPMSADYILSFGEESRKRLISFGVPKNKIIIIGAFQFDKYNNTKIKNNPNKIVFISNAVPSNDPLPEIHITKRQEKNILTMLFQVLKKFPKYKLIIKGRKNWDMNELSKIISKKEDFKNVGFIEEASPISLLSDANFVIGGYTTMAFEAILLNKPYVLIGFKNNDNFFNYKGIKQIKKVYNPKQLEKAIKSIQKNKRKTNNKKDLEKELYKLDGKSTQRAIKFINKILLKRK